MIWLGVALCLVLSFVFSGIEAGILSVNRIRLKHQVKLRDPAALKLSRLLKEPERLLVTVLIVTNLMNIIGIALVTRELSALLGARGYAVALVAVLPVYLIGVELLSKSLFRRFPYRALAALAEPLRLADMLLAPLHFVGRGLIHRVFGRRPAKQQKLFVAREEFKYLTFEGERTGALSKESRHMIHSVVDFRVLRARDLMVPIEKVRSIAADASIAELLDMGRRTNIDRWPVTDENGQIVGLINVFEIAMDTRRRGRVESFQRRIIKVPPNDSAFSVLRRLRAARSTLAAVVGADGQSLGIVTWEDLIKRLVNPAAA